ncbi:tRNA(Ile)-lysidine synthetase [Yamadazyma tenuis]|uniref:tRNA(Ile)-lysidine synthetase n=1 Tax=Candida tenuis (strain ATCC 10573 / BCRC 21748 / CBS 615 / JCM 9827 / NBRC 10315 / NRRL Y-1498 / VKM Y-70) TaxID=590646 RepID=G3B1P0_CANTC|nr:uncharacterized protein CANTEDRAFT_104499 [Yamadazyma tenuis ATCC 10573]EGV64996.1 hypothetical protein CANTEDRAFT_104499 [Yamadazyma tenuis ATCC 10573]WEJ97257.1 tRNA(Ile)-lysidine synthetase [Yamadazyma tenuis]
MIEIQAFKNSLVQCFGKGDVPKKVLVALSGGVDSVCMTYLLSQYRDKFNPEMKLHAVTIDHNYRKESAEEARKVGELVSKWKVDHYVVPLTYEKPLDQITNFELVARTKRYDVFDNLAKQLNIHNIFVAHNYNDQLETCMQRIRAQSTVFGLTGLKQRALIPIPNKLPFDYVKPIEVVRPLLSFSKKEIIDTCVQNNIQWFEDKTNQDIFLTDRNLYRVALNEYIPEVLKKNPDSDFKSISYEKIGETIQQSKALVSYVQARTKTLRESMLEKDQLRFDPKNGIVSLKMDKSAFLENGPLALGRFLFEILHPYSASQNYFWSFTKVLNKVVPRLNRIVEEGTFSPQRFTILHLVFDVRVFDDNVVIRISRQPVSGPAWNKVIQNHKSSSGMSDWILYDNRYWLRFRSSYDATFTIVPYYPPKHFPMLKKQYLGGIPGMAATSTPLIMFKNGDLSLPTYNLAPSSFYVEWHLKDNAIIELE